MSHFSRIAIKFKDQESLIKALAQMGFKPQIHASPIHLYGWRGDKREQLAHIIVPRQQIGGPSNDLGFYWNGNDYECLISEYDQYFGNARAGEGLGKQFLSQLRSNYVNVHTEKIATSLGGKIVSRNKEGTKTTIRISVPSPKVRLRR